MLIVKIVCAFLLFAALGLLVQQCERQHAGESWFWQSVFALLLLYATTRTLLGG